MTHYINTKQVSFIFVQHKLNGTFMDRLTYKNSAQDNFDLNKKQVMITNGNVSLFIALTMKD